jgi:ABC-type Fe3+/spermidine/putrescine transport system ATPase subunit
MNDSIAIKGLRKQFGNVTAVHDLDLAIRQGEFFTLLGPSGCGKTTTLRLVGGLEKPDSGEISLDDQCLAAPAQRIFVNPEKRNMGMVFQSYALWPHLTVFENVAYPLRLRRITKVEIRQKVRDSLNLVGLSGLGDRPVPALSGGQQQRVALARALVFSPRVLLLDEPLSNLDAQLREETRREIKTLQRRLGITVLMVTHDQAEALSVSDRVGIMNGGRLEQVDTPEEIYYEPSTSFARDFLGRMFMVDGTIMRATALNAEIKLTGLDNALFSVAKSQFRAGDTELRAGSVVTLAIRPEQIAAVETAPPKRNVLPATVESSQFLGERHEYGIAFGSEYRTLALSSGQRFRVGQRIFLELPQDKITVWRADGLAGQSPVLECTTARPGHGGLEEKVALG